MDAIKECLLDLGEMEFVFAMIFPVLLIVFLITSVNEDKDL